MKRLLSFLPFALVWIAGFAQQGFIPTDFFVLRGEIRNPQTVTVGTLGTLHLKELKDITTLDHLGEPKSLLRNVKGVLLKELLQRAELNLTSQKQVHAFYVECVATDGYKAVFSWNELMNTPSGDNIYIITGRDGKPMAGLDDRIAILQIAEPGKGRVSIKGVQQITILSVK